MNEAKRGNFEFIKEIYPDLYDNLYKAENLAYIDCKEAGRNLRIALETWLIYLTREYGISSEGSRGTLADKQYALKCQGKLPILEQCDEKRGKLNKKREYRYAYISEIETTEYMEGYSLWKNYGNRCSHPDEEAKEHDPKPIYFNLDQVLRIAHEAFRSEYKRIKKKEAKKIGSFDDRIMPIGEHFVINFYIPQDRLVSNCIREFETCSYHETGHINKYGIVRVFEKGDMDEKLLRLRDQEAFSLAESEAGIQFDGNVQVEALSKMSSPYSSHYVQIYKFTQKPERLTEFVLQKMSLLDKIEFCARIGEILYTFHHLQIPIYHRNLSHDSIYVCKNKAGKYEPSIIKLDCAKIESGDYGTVIENVEDMQEKIKLLSIKKYNAPEVNTYIQDPSIGINWEKADVYSLGVLFFNILDGQFGTREIKALLLRKSAVDMQLLQLIDQMCYADPNRRPDTGSVMQRWKKVE